MCFFKSKQKTQPFNSAVPKNPLVAGLVSNHEPTFLSALREAVSISDQGDYGGIQAIREAIRIRSGKNAVSFYEPGIRRGFAGEELDRYVQARPSILSLVKRHSLLEDPKISGDYISALMFSLDGASMQNLVMEIFTIGGAGAGYEFQLLYNELRSSARWKER